MVPPQNGDSSTFFRALPLPAVLRRKLEGREGQSSSWPPQPAASWVPWGPSRPAHSSLGSCQAPGRGWGGHHLLGRGRPETGADGQSHTRLLTLQPGHPTYPNLSPQKGEGQLLGRTTGQGTQPRNPAGLAEGGSDPVPLMEGTRERTATDGTVFLQIPMLKPQRVTV